MIKVAHLVDDPALGGVNRLLNSLVGGLSGQGRHVRRVEQVRGRVAPSVPADVVVVHFTLGWSKLPFLATLRARAPSARLVLVEHSYTAAFETTCVPEQRRFRARLRLGYRMVDDVVAVSRGQAHWIEEAGLVGADKLRVIPCVNDLAPFTQLPVPESGVPLRLGAYGRFDRQKGYETLIDAMRSVPPDIATLDLAGYGPLEAALRARADGLPYVRIHGRVDPVVFCGTLGAIAIPSRWEAGAVTCWEGRAAGRPMIVSHVDGLPEQVPPEFGIIVAPQDVRGWARAIVRLASADRSSMASAARRSTAGAFESALEEWRFVLRPQCASPRTERREP